MYTLVKTEIMDKTLSVAPVIFDLDPTLQIYLTAEKDSEVVLKYEVYKEEDKVYVVYYANGQNLGKFHLVKESL